MNHSQVIAPLSVDSVIFGFEADELKVLLIKRKETPEKDKWALPGGFIRYSEDIDEAARRILEELTGVNTFVKQLRAFGDVNRYPYGRVITIAYYAMIRPENFKLNLPDEATEVQWVNIYDMPALVFDHNNIIETALRSIRRRVRHEPIGFNLLPEQFPLLKIQRLYESILDTTFDKPNFRRKILKMGILEPLNKKQEGVAHRSAQLYKFNKTNYDEMVEKGYIFEM